MTSGSLMKVESIAECNTFDLYLELSVLESFFCLFESGRFTMILLYKYIFF